MNVVTSPVSLRTAEIFSRSLSTHLRTSSRLLALGAAAAALLIGSGGTAVGQTAHFAGAQTSVGSGFFEPFGVAVDSSGNLFVADADTFGIYEILAVNGTIPPSPTIRTLVRTSSNPEHVAVDSSGNVYYTELDTNDDFRNNSVKEILAVNGVIPASPTIRQLGSGLFYPAGVAVDASGNVYVADTDNGVVKEMLAVNGSVPASPTILTLGSGFYTPEGIAVDPAGNVYVTATDSVTSADEVIEIAAVNGSIPPSPTILKLATGFCGPDGVTLDSAGNVFFSAYCNSAVYKIAAVNGSVPANPTISQVSAGFGGIEGVAVDNRTGNIYVGGVYNSVPEIIASGTNFGAQNVGATSSRIPLSFTFDSAGTLGSTAVLTQGSAGLDFTDAGTGTCTANRVYQYGSVCTVDVVFTAKASGMRNGAVVLYSSTGSAIATGYVQGQGVGPQINFLPGTQSTLGSGFSNPSGVAMDGAGNLYVGDTSNNTVKEILAVNGVIPGSPTIVPLGSGFSNPRGIAVDGAGNLYVADQGAVKEIVAAMGGIPASPTIRTLGSFQGPESVAVDGKGNVYTTQPIVSEVDEIQAVNGVIPASPTIVPLGSGFNLPVGVTVDAAGNVYVADTGNGAVKELLAVNGVIPASPTINTLGSGFVNPTGLALDGNGNLFVADFGANAAREILAYNGVIPVLPETDTLFFSSLNTPFAIAVDGGGNAYVADAGNNRVVKLDVVDPPNLLFVPTPVGSTSTDSPLRRGLANAGNAPLIFPIPATGTNPSIAPNFTFDTTSGGTCPLLTPSSFQPAVLQQHQSCVLSISFSPVSGGAISGSLVVTDNNLNAAAPGYTTHTIALSGTAVQATPVITWSAPHAITYGTPLDATQLNATANVPGAFTYSPAAGTILPVGTATLTVTFTPTDTATYTTTTASVSMHVNAATPTITWNTPAPITYGTALSAAQLNASSPVAGTFIYTPAAGAVLGAGQQTLSVRFTPADSADYSTAVGSVILTVNKATPVTTWATPPPVPYGTGLSGTQLNASANVPGTFAYNPAAGAILDLGTNTLTATFTPADTQDYAIATATVLLTVTPNFSLQATPSSLAIVQNNSATSTISVVSRGSVGNVQLSVSGLPGGVTASFSANPTTSSSVLTFRVGPKATVGTANVVVTGISGNLTHVVTIPLTIVARK